MRVVGGSLKGRVLTPFKGTAVRPTSDKVKGAIFNMLGQRFDGERVLDLFAGTGSLGIEAISRGAAEAVFVDRDCTLVKKNLTALGIDSKESARLIERDVVSALKGFKGTAFDVIFIDAPYKDAELLKDILTEIHRRELLSSDGLIVCELSKRYVGEVDFSALSNMSIKKEKTYGDTAIVILSRKEA